MPEMQKQREMRDIEIDAQLGSELRKVDSAIRARRETRRGSAGAGAGRTGARGDRARAGTGADRTRTRGRRTLARDRAQARAGAGEVAQSKAESEADVLIRRAQGRSAGHAHARGSRASALLAESEGAQAQIAAENSRSDEPDAPTARAVPARQDAGDRRADDEAGREDREHPHPPGQRVRRQHTASAAAAAAAMAAARKPPVNQVMDSIIGMALQLPALKSIGESIGVDFSSAIMPVSRRPSRRQTCARSR